MASHDPDAKIVGEVIYVFTVDRNLDAETVVEAVYAYTGSKDLDAKSVEEAASVSMTETGHNARFAA